jgi:hypothetical protein
MTLTEITSPKKFTLTLDENELEAIIFVLGQARSSRCKAAITGYTDLADEVYDYLREQRGRILWTSRT